MNLYSYRSQFIKLNINLIKEYLIEMKMVDIFSQSPNCKTCRSISKSNNSYGNFIENITPTTSKEPKVLLERLEQRLTVPLKTKSLTAGPKNDFACYSEKRNFESKLQDEVEQRRDVLPNAGVSQPVYHKMLKHVPHFEKIETQIIPKCDNKTLSETESPPVSTTHKSLKMNISIPSIHSSFLSRSISYSHASERCTTSPDTNKCSSQMRDSDVCCDSRVKELCSFRCNFDHYKRKIKKNELRDNRSSLKIEPYSWGSRDHKKVKYDYFHHDRKNKKHQTCQQLTEQSRNVGNNLSNQYKSMMKVDQHYDDTTHIQCNTNCDNVYKDSSNRIIPQEEPKSNKSSPKSDYYKYKTRKMKFYNHTLLEKVNEIVNSAQVSTSFSSRIIRNENDNCQGIRDLTVYTKKDLVTKPRGRRRSLSIDTMLELFKIKIQNPALPYSSKASVSLPNLHSGCDTTFASIDEKDGHSLHRNEIAKHDATISEKYNIHLNNFKTQRLVQRCKQMDNTLSKDKQPVDFSREMKPESRACESKHSKSDILRDTAKKCRSSKNVMQFKGRHNPPPSDSQCGELVAKKVKLSRTNLAKIWKKKEYKTNSEVNKQSIQKTKHQTRKQIKDLRSKDHDSMRSEAVTQQNFEQLYERDRGHRLAQEIPGFNWLELKIRNSTYNKFSTSAPVIQKPPSTTTSDGKEPTTSIPKKNYRFSDTAVIPSLHNDITIKGKAHKDIISNTGSKNNSAINKSDEKTHDVLNTSLCYNSVSNKLSKNCNDQTDSSKKTDLQPTWDNAFYMGDSKSINYLPIKPQNTVSEEKERHIVTSFKRCHLQTAVPPLIPSSKITALPKQQLCTFRQLGNPSQSSVVQLQDVSPVVGIIQSEKSPSNTLGIKMLTDNSQNDPEMSSNDSRGDLEQNSAEISSSEDAANLFKVSSKLNNMANEKVNNVTNISDAVKSDQITTDVNTSQTISSEKLLILTDAFKSMLNIPTAVSLLQEEKESAKNKEVKPPHQQEHLANEMTVAKISNIITLSPEEPLKQLNSEDKNGSTSNEAEKPVLITIPELMLPFSFGSKEAELSNSLIAALYGELLRTREEVENLKKVQQQMLQMDTCESKASSGSRHPVETNGRPTFGNMSEENSVYNASPETSTIKAPFQAHTESSSLEGQVSKAIFQSHAGKATPEAQVCKVSYQVPPATPESQGFNFSYQVPAANATPEAQGCNFSYQVHAGNTTEAQVCKASYQVHTGNSTPEVQVCKPTFQVYSTNAIPEARLSNAIPDEKATFEARLGNSNPESIKQGGTHNKRQYHVDENMLAARKLLKTNSIPVDYTYKPLQEKAASKPQPILNEKETNKYSPINFSVAPFPGKRGYSEDELTDQRKINVSVNEIWTVPSDEIPNKPSTHIRFSLPELPQLPIPNLRRHSEPTERIHNDLNIIKSRILKDHQQPPPSANPTTYKDCHPQYSASNDKCKYAVHPQPITVSTAQTLISYHSIPIVTHNNVNVIKEVQMHPQIPYGYNVPVIKSIPSNSKESSITAMHRLNREIPSGIPLKAKRTSRQSQEKFLNATQFENCHEHMNKPYSQLPNHLLNKQSNIHKDSNLMFTKNSGEINQSCYIPPYYIDSSRIPIYPQAPSSSISAPVRLPDPHIIPHPHTQIRPSQSFPCYSSQPQHPPSAISYPSTSQSKLPGYCSPLHQSILAPAQTKIPDRVSGNHSSIPQHLPSSPSIPHQSYPVCKESQISNNQYTTIHQNCYSAPSFQPPSNCTHHFQPQVPNPYLQNLQNPCSHHLDKCKDNEQLVMCQAERNENESDRHSYTIKATSSQTSSNKRKCVVCPEVAQFVCSGCKTAWYCSKDCQV